MAEDWGAWLFPHEQVRPFQSDLLALVSTCLQKGNHAIIHAPTGLGKTASTVAPALAYALNHKKTVFFLTSRHTQHHIVIDTLKEIKRRYGTLFTVTDIIGKKWMCLQSGVSTLPSGDFADYCKSLREGGKCSYYVNARDGQKLTPKAAALMDGLSRSPLHLEEFISQCSDEEVCPYEMAVAQSARASVIVADYNYIFNPQIRNAFLSKIKSELKDSIIIVDEGHNLPLRMRELLSSRLSTLTLYKAMREAKKYKCMHAFPLLEKLYQVIVQLAADCKGEAIVAKEAFCSAAQQLGDYDELIELFDAAADIVRAEQRTSALGTIAFFLEEWPKGDDGFARIMTKTPGRMKDTIYTLSKRCLDPALVTQEPIRQSHSTILMSGTMTPTTMYRELLGFPQNTVEGTFKSPFPSKNRLVLVVPETTTRFSTRSPGMYQRIAAVCGDMTNRIPGNCAIFFPSYAIRDDVARTLVPLCRKTMFVETPALQKHEKKEMLERFSAYKTAVLLAVSGGNFSEGIDLPGILKCVIIVGLPLQRPDLEIKELIAYYDKRFGKGWDYGYVFPAFSRCIQGAGRGIRTEKDRSVLVFLDERFSWPQYRSYFPADWDVLVTRNYEPHVHGFFSDAQH